MPKRFLRQVILPEWAKTIEVTESESELIVRGVGGLYFAPVSLWDSAEEYIDLMAGFDQGRKAPRPESQKAPHLLFASASSTERQIDFVRRFGPVLAHRAQGDAFNEATIAHQSLSVLSAEQQIFAQLLDLIQALNGLHDWSVRAFPLRDKFARFHPPESCRNDEEGFVSGPWQTVEAWNQMSIGPARTHEGLGRSSYFGEHVRAGARIENRERGRDVSGNSPEDEAARRSRTPDEFIGRTLRSTDQQRNYRATLISKLTTLKMLAGCYPECVFVGSEVGKFWADITYWLSDESKLMKYDILSIVTDAHNVLCRIFNSFPLALCYGHGVTVEMPRISPLGIRPALYFMLRSDYVFNRRIRLCAVPNCGSYFVADRSDTRHCSEDCRNRARQKRHYAKRRSAGKPSR